MYMKLLFLFVLLLPVSLCAQDLPDTAYLSDVRIEMAKLWPKNRTINLVFHGHSVPAGYWTNHEVHTLESYPQLVLRKLKEKYPYAVINIVVTAIGGENSLKGQTRMENVLAHRPDVLFVDYALNDRFADIGKVKAAWEKMISDAKARGVKVILLTPSPDQRVNILEKGNTLQEHARQIRELAASHSVGLADPFVLFQDIAAKEGNVREYMSHVNHPNAKGHEVIAETIMKWF